MNFRQLDLNLLRVLAAIHRTGSVTLAGKALSLSQPATSNALSRLRDYFEDELFVRAPSGLKPTRLCEQLAPAVLAQLLALETVVTGHEDFEPAHSDMHWQLSLSDLGEMLFLPGLAGALRSQAPGARLSNISVAANEVAAALEAREIDLAIGILQPKHRGIRTELLFRENYVAVASPQWRPASGRSGKTLTAQQLAAGGIRRGRAHGNLSRQRRADAGAHEAGRPHRAARPPLRRPARPGADDGPAVHRARDVRAQPAPALRLPRLGHPGRAGL
jgi:DNA-binding transcriptional LysR family regulator